MLPLPPLFPYGSTISSSSSSSISVYFLFGPPLGLVYAFSLPATVHQERAFFLGLPNQWNGSFSFPNQLNGSVCEACLSAPGGGGKKKAIKSRIACMWPTQLNVLCIHTEYSYICFDAAFYYQKSSPIFKFPCQRWCVPAFSLSLEYLRDVDRKRELITIASLPLSSSTRPPPTPSLFAPSSRRHL